jgi:hypothetical protein
MQEADRATVVPSAPAEGAFPDEPDDEVWLDVKRRRVTSNPPWLDFAAFVVGAPAASKDKPASDLKRDRVAMEEDSSSHVREGRGRDAKQTTRTSALSGLADPAAACGAAADTPSSHLALPQLDAAELKAELTERNQLMFVVGASEPVASGRLPVLRAVTKEAVHLAWQVTSERAKKDGPQLSRSFGNFDQRV